MSHSLQSYIAKLSTEQLEHFIAQYYAGELTEDYSSVIPYLQHVLNQRKENKDHPAG